MLVEIRPAPGELDDEEGTIRVGLAEGFRQSQLGAEASFDLALEGSALDELPRGVPAREVVDVDVIVAVSVLGVLLGGDVLLEVLVQTAPRGVGLTAQNDHGGRLAPAVGEGVLDGEGGLALAVGSDDEQEKRNGEQGAEERRRREDADLFACHGETSFLGNGWGLLWGIITRTGGNVNGNFFTLQF